MAARVLLLRLIALRLLHGRARTDGISAFFSPIRAMPPSRLGDPQRLAWNECTLGLYSDLNPRTRCRSPAWDHSHSTASLQSVPVWRSVARARVQAFGTNQNFHLKNRDDPHHPCRVIKMGVTAHLRIGSPTTLQPKRGAGSAPDLRSRTDPAAKYEFYEFPSAPPIPASPCS
jgi:hypothetical protein